MRSVLVFSAVLCLVSATAFSITDSSIEFSPGGDNPGHWLYQGSTSASGTFSFIQDVDIDYIQGAQTDALYDQFVFLPDLTLTNYVAGTIAGTGSGDVATGGLVEIKDGSGNVLLAGTLAEGFYHAIWATSVIYPQVAADIKVTSVNNIIGSAFLSGVSVDDYFDLNLTLNASSNFETMIVNVETGTNGFSGSMIIIPEPSTIALLGLGGLLLRKRKNA